MRGVPLTIEQFWANVQPTGFCWLWQGGQNRGYGRFGQRGAHRVAYELLVGPIPSGLHLDHLCRVPLCVNPDHLEPVTFAENTKRSPILGWKNASKVSCPRGHPYSFENTYVRNGKRHCRQCSREKRRLSRQPHERNRNV